MSRGKTIHIWCPVASTKLAGNRITTDRWAKVFETLGYSVLSSEAHADILVALHAVKSADVVAAYRERKPKGQVVVALTGTDIYGDAASIKITHDVLKVADRIVVLQDAMLKELTTAERTKATVIVQAAVVPNPRPYPDDESFTVCVLSHLRDEKDPLLICKAIKNLPWVSKVKVIHYGAALDNIWARKAKTSNKKLIRYEWHGEKTHEQSLQLLCKSRLLVTTSRAEGGPSVISEALACGVPILATNIPAHVALLGADYEGLFPVGKDLVLAQLIFKAEKEPIFYRILEAQCAKRAVLVEPKREQELWDAVLKN